MNQSATIKLFLPFGDPKKVRTAEISNWSGKAVASPRSDIDHFLARDELSKPGVYFLLGIDPEDGKPVAYIGEAETVSDRIKQHRAKDFWNAAIVFVSKDVNLTKAHIRYMEGRLIEAASKIGRYKIVNSQVSGARLPESDPHEMEVYLDRIAQLLPVLGSDILTPIVSTQASKGSFLLTCSMKGAVANGERTPNGFVVYKGSTAVLEERASARTQGLWIIILRNKLKDEGALVEKSGFLEFTRNVEFSSPSAAAAAVIHAGNAAGPVAWKDSNGRTLKELEESP